MALVQSAAHLAAAAAGDITSTTLQFVGCDVLPELQGEYVLTNEGRGDLCHEYPTYKQVVVSAGATSHFCYFWDSESADDGARGWYIAIEIATVEGVQGFAEGAPDAPPPGEGSWMFCLSPEAEFVKGTGGFQLGRLSQVPTARA